MFNTQQSPSESPNTMLPTWEETQWDPKEAASPVHVLRHLLTCTSLQAVTGSRGEVALHNLKMIISLIKELNLHRPVPLVGGWK